MMKDIIFPTDGVLQTGCNYWASHAGTAMWHDWRPEIIERDFACLEAHGMTIARVFPLWSDFQPVMMLRECAGRPKEVTLTDETTVVYPGEDGLSSVMLERFRALADTAHRHHLKLVVALLTGWMSGRLFVPPLLEGRNLLTDPEALRWEGRFLRGVVRALKDHPAIIAWEPGNECNCLSGLAADTAPAASAHWLEFIVNTIRSVDGTRPVFTGMHGTRANPNEGWFIADQGEYCDALTTHPYPAFTPYCGRSPLNSIPAVYHSTAESLFYRGISGKPTFVEEIGSLGPAVLCEERRRGYILTTLASAWAHNLGGYLWWCGFNQCHLTHAPYRWVAMERELGLFLADGTPTPAAEAMRSFAQRISALPFRTLPPRKVDAVVLLTPGQDQWQVAYGAFVLTKQAGLEVEFASPWRPLPEASLYIMPALQGHLGMPQPQYRQLMQRIHDSGAALIVTDAGNGVLQPFQELFGCYVDYATMRPEQQSLALPGEATPIVMHRNWTHKLLAGTADVLATNADGAPMVTRQKYGKGLAIYLNAAPELNVLDEARPRLYNIIRFLVRAAGMALPDKDPAIGRTYHTLPDGRVITVEINYADHDVEGLAANDFRVRL